MDMPESGSGVEAFSPSTSPGYMANLMARLFERALARRIHALGAMPGQFPVLLCLWAEDGLSQTELTARVRIEQPTMARTLTRMERAGLVRRQPDPDDRRRALVYLTDKARDLQGHARRRGEADTDCMITTIMTSPTVGASGQQPWPACVFLTDSSHNTHRIVARHTPAHGRHDRTTHWASHSRGQSSHWGA